MYREERRERAGVEARFDRRPRLGLGKPLGVAGQAVRAMPARLRARPAEVADERADLAAVVGDELEHAFDPRRLGAFATREALDQPAGELVLRAREREQRVALAQLGRLQLDETLLVEVLDAATIRLRSSALRRRAVSERRPGAPVFPVATTRRAGARLVEAAEDVPSDASRAGAAGADRTAFLASTPSSSRQVSTVFRTSGRTSWRIEARTEELRADGVVEHEPEQAYERLGGRRVAEGEFSSVGVVGAGEELADAVGPVVRRARSPAVRLGLFGRLWW
jgi:hypothetical protein